MGDVMKKVQPGDPLRIPAETFNTFIDAAGFYQSQQQNRGRKPGRDFRQTGIVLVKNNSGADRGRFDVLGIDGPIISPTDNLDEFKSRVAFKGVTPDIETHYGAFAVLLEPLANGKIGRACVSGVCQALVSVEGEFHDRADIYDGQTTTLRSGYSGAAQILWVDVPVPFQTGQYWAVVRLSTPRAAIERIEVKEGEVYMPGDTSVVCRLPDIPEEPEVAVYQADVAHRFGIGRGGSGPYTQAGTLGYAFFSRRYRWELLTLDGKLTAAGRCDENISTGATGTVSIYWNDYTDPGSLVNSGRNVEAINWTGPKVNQGDNVIISYDRQEDLWMISEQPGGIIVMDEGFTQVNPARILDFTGDGVDATWDGSGARITVPGCDCP